MARISGEASGRRPGDGVVRIHRGPLLGWREMEVAHRLTTGKDRRRGTHHDCEGRQAVEMPPLRDPRRDSRERPALSPMKFDDAEVARVLADPESILRFLPDAKPSNGGWLTCCPVHAEKTPSCRVSVRGGKARWHCFGCGARGDALDLLKALEGLAFTDALLRLGAQPDRPPPGLTLDQLRERAMDRLTFKTPWGKGDVVIVCSTCGAGEGVTVAELARMRWREEPFAGDRDPLRPGEALCPRCAHRASLSAFVGKMPAGMDPADFFAKK